MNEEFRASFTGGVVTITSGMPALCEDVRAEVLKRVRDFKHFTPENNPHGENDFGSFKIADTTMASSIEPAEIEVETFLHRQPDLDSIARRDATALRRRDAALRHIEQRRSRRKKEEAQSQKIAATRSMNGKGEEPLAEPTPLEELPIAADPNHQNGHG